MEPVQIPFDAHCGTVAFWRSAMRSRGARTWQGAMRAHALQHGKAIAMLADDSALIMGQDGKGQRIPSGGVVWKAWPSVSTVGKVAP